MGTNSGGARRSEYHKLIAAGVENAMTRGYLFGRQLEARREVIPSRGAVIYPDAPTGLMRHWWRAQHYNRWPEDVQRNLFRVGHYALPA